MNIRTAAAGGVALTVASYLAATTTLQNSFDYSTLPREPGEVEKSLSDMTVDLAKAIEIATEHTGGKAQYATVDINRTPPFIEVMTYGSSKAQKVFIDSSSGEVKRTVDIPRFPGQEPVGELIKADNGLMYFQLAEGDGKKPAGPNSMVRVKYTGWLTDGTKFDSSLDHPQGPTYVTRLNQVIRGWTEGILSMRVGEKRKLIIPPQLGYGQSGAGGVIPPNAMLVFDVELTEILGE